MSAADGRGTLPPHQAVNDRIQRVEQQQRHDERNQDRRRELQQEHRGAKRDDDKSDRLRAPRHHTTRRP